MMHGSNEDRPVNSRWPEAIYWHHRFQDAHHQELTDEEILHWLAWIESPDNRLIFEKYCGLLAANRRAKEPPHPGNHTRVERTLA